jgi:selenocysteine lyase/cysteine desulfurase
MQVTRRAFLAGAGTIAATAFVPGRLVEALEAQTPAMSGLSTWSEVRAQFPLVRDHLHFASFYIASHPKPVRDAIDGFRRALDQSPFLTVEHGMFESEAENMQVKVRQEIAAYLGGRPDEIALTPNTTTGLALVHHGLTLRPGDEVLTTVHDHYSHHESIRYAAARSGATARRISLFDRSADATIPGIVERVRAGLRPETRVLAVTWVHSSTGVRLPIREIAAAVAEANRSRSEANRALLVVDGVHGLGSVDETVAELGCDFFCAGTHKWMFAPRGTGLIWARPENWARVTPTIPSFSADDVYDAWMNEVPAPAPQTAARVTPGGFWAYEHQWAMGAAFRFHAKIGRKRIADRIRALNTQCKDGLAKIDGVTLHTPRDPALSAGVICFEVKGVPPADVVKRLLEKRIIASTSPYRVTYVRLAPSLINDEQEVETAIRAVRDIAT